MQVEIATKFDIGTREETIEKVEIPETVVRAIVNAKLDAMDYAQRRLFIKNLCNAVK